MSLGIDFVFCIKNGPSDIPSGAWAHRGLHTEHPQNSIQAFKAALDSGFEGVELDVFYIERLNDFVVSHDPQISGSEDTLLRLEKVLQRFEDSLYYWVDLKNLNRKNYQDIRLLLNETSKFFNVKDKLFIESAAAVPLGNLAKSGFKTLYWAQYNRNFPKRWLKLKLIKLYMILYPYSGVSCQHDYCTNDFIKHFYKKNIFIFTINSEEEFLRLKPYMKVFLTDLEINNFL